MVETGDSYLLYTDGASRGNPGPASIGFVIKTESGQLVWEEGRKLGIHTNNVAEYSALVEGLKKLKELNAQKIHVFADSELMVKQIKGQYRVKNQGLKPLYRSAMELIQSFSQWDIEHVRREHNEEADALANQALDS